MGESIAVFGATSSIAEATVKHFANENATLILVGRNIERLKILKSQMLTHGAAQVDLLTCDFSDSAQAEQIWMKCTDIHQTIDRVLLAYGTLSDQHECETNMEAARHNYELNLISPISILSSIAASFEQSGKGQIVVISSVAGDRGRRSNYYYGSAKAGLDTFCSGLRSRLSKAKVSVLTVRPGFVDTPMTAHIPKNPLFASPEKVGKDIFDAMKKKREIIYVPSFWRLILFIIRIIPESLFKRLPI